MTFATSAQMAWANAAAGEIEEARRLYRAADEKNIYGGRLNPDLSVLRHSVGEASGCVEPPEFDEHRVPGFYMHDHVRETPCTFDMTRTDVWALTKNVRAFIDGFSGGFHAENIVRHLPHVFVISTGRCGTVSLYRLLQGTNVAPFHAYWWMGSITGRWEMMCRLMSGCFDDGATVWHDWMATRAAEWLGCMATGRPMVALNHTDTIFAPVFAALHPESRFVHLHRNRDRVIRSFVDKDQSPGDLGNQLRPLAYAFDPEFRWSRLPEGKTAQIRFLCDVTESLAAGMADAVGPGRFHEVRAEDLFDGDREKIGALLRFIGSGVDVDRAAAHFATPRNVKEHKLCARS